MEGIILQTDFKGDLLKEISILFRKVSMRHCGLAEYICFSQDVNVKVALSSLQFNIIELVLVVLDIKVALSSLQFNIIELVLVV